MVELLFVRPVKIIVGPIVHELSLTHGAGAGRNRPAGGVQTLHKSGVGQEVTAGGTFCVPDRLQQEALNRAGIRATRDVGAGIDSALLYHPHPAAIEGTLPGRGPTLGRDNIWVRVFIDTLEVGDDLDRMSEGICKECGFGTGGGVPGSATSVRGQASVALAAGGVAN